MSSEKEKLQRELEYLSQLIEAHKSTVVEHTVGNDMFLTQNTQGSTVVVKSLPKTTPNCEHLPVESSHMSAAKSVSLSAASITLKQPSLTKCVQVFHGTTESTDLPLSANNEVVELSAIESANCDLSMTEDGSILYCDDGLPDITCILASNMKSLYNTTMAKPGIAHARTSTSHSLTCPTDRSRVDTKAQFVSTLTVPCEDAGHGERTVQNASLSLSNERRIVLTGGDRDKPFSESLLVTTVNNKAASAVGGRKVVTASQPLHLPLSVSGFSSQPSLIVQFSTLPGDADHISSRLAKCQSLPVKPVTKHVQTNSGIDIKESEAGAQVVISNRYKLVRRNPVNDLQNSSSGNSSVQRLQSTRSKQQHLSSLSDINVNKYKLIRKPVCSQNATSSSPVLKGSMEVPELDLKDKGRVSDECMAVEGSVPVPMLTSVGLLNLALPFNRYKLIRKRNKSLSQSSEVVASKKLKTLRREIKEFAAGKDGVTTPTNSATTKSSPLAPISKYKLVRKQSFSNTRSTTRTVSKKCGGPVRRESALLSLVRSSCGRQRLRSKAASFSSKYALKHSAHDVVDEFDMNRVLGRRVANLSRSKYKFVNAHNVSTTRRSATSLRNKLHQSLLKFDRRSSREKCATRSGFSQHQTNGVIRWHRRRPSFYSITRQISTATTVEKGKSSVISTPSRTSITTRVAQRIVSQMRWSAAEQRRKAATTTAVRTYCMYFNRFGRCSRGDKCKYIHDPDKVSVCTRYLRGTCKVTDCLFSHRVSPDKMPTCLYFIRGVCSRNECPYRHVRVAVNAQPCLDFARGYCQLGDMCQKDHVLICPDFTKSGGVTCPRGKQCPLKHVRHKVMATGVAAGKLIQDELPKLNNISGNVNQSVNDDDVNLPMKHRRLPSFIALDTSDSSSLIAMPPQDSVVKASDERTPLLLRPRLVPPSNYNSNLSSWLRDSLD